MHVTSAKVDMHVPDMAGISHMAFCTCSRPVYCREEAKSLPALICVHPLSQHNDAI